MNTVICREEMRSQFKLYRSRAHLTQKHVDRTLHAIDTMWRESRKKRSDMWDILSKHNQKKAKEPITGTEIKKAFRDYICSSQAERCCYCRQWLFRMAHAKPIEHILPKKHYPHYSLHFWNLAVACTDCNRLKGDALWGNFCQKRFSYPQPSECTDVFHPRFHKYDDHVRFVYIATNCGAISVYKGLTRQGRYLCAQLLHKVAAERMLLDSSPSISSAIEQIETYRATVADRPKLDAFLQALDSAVLQVIK